MFFENIKIKLNSRIWMTEVFSSDFPVLRTSAASMISTASTTSIASMTSTASFHQIFCWSWWLDHPWHPNDQIDLSGLCNLTGLNSLNSPISSKNFLIQMVWPSPAPKWPILVPFCGMDHQKSNFLLIFDTLPVGGWWGQPMLLFWKLIDATQISKPLEPTRHHNLIKLWNLLSLRADLLCILQYETPCNKPLLL